MLTNHFVWSLSRDREGELHLYLSKDTLEEDYHCYTIIDTFLSSSVTPFHPLVIYPLENAPCFFSNERLYLLPSDLITKGCANVK